MFSRALPRLGYLVVFLSLQSTAFAQNGCAKDDLGRVLCAPSGGSAVNTLTGVACAPGRCAVNSLGYAKCSRELGGGAIADNLGRIICVGGCIDPSKEFCLKPSRGESK